MAKDFAPLLQRVLMVMVYPSMAAMVLHYSPDISSIVVSMGIGTVAVGLAAQDTLSNMIAGFFIMFDRPFRIGDRIELEQDPGRRGGHRPAHHPHQDTRTPSFRSTPSCPRAVVNHSYPDRRARVELTFTVAFDAEIARVPDIFAARAAGVPEILADPAPDCSLTGSSALGLQFSGGGWVGDYTLKARHERARPKVLRRPARRRRAAGGGGGPPVWAGRPPSAAPARTGDRRMVAHLLGPPSSFSCCRPPAAAPSAARGLWGRLTSGTSPSP